MQSGCIAVAMVQRQVMVVQASRTHSSNEPWLDVHTYTPLGDRVFMPSEPCPYARIAAADVLAVLPLFALSDRPTTGVLVLPDVAWDQYTKISARTQKKYEKMFAAWSSKR